MLLNETTENYQMKKNNRQTKIEYSIDENHEDISAPIASMDLEDFLDILSSNDNAIDEKNYLNDDETIAEIQQQQKLKNKTKSNLSKSIDLCNSLEDLVKTFDQNVKDCFRNYKNIDVGQLAPVQVRSQEDIINDSQMWYTLTGHFGNLFPIDYSSKKSLIRKYHNNSLNIKSISNNNNNNKKFTCINHNQKLTSSTNSKQQQQQPIITLLKANSTKLNNNHNKNKLNNKKSNYNNKLFDEEDYLDRMDDDDLINDNFDLNEDFDHDIDEDEGLLSQDEYDEEFYNDSKSEDVNHFNLNKQDECDDFLDFDEDEEELKEQLDMHSMILIKGLYNECDLEEPLITAEQVLNEIDSMMNLQEEFYDEMTPDSGFYSAVGLNTSLNSTNGDIPLDLNGLSYITYVNTFAQHASNINNANNSLNNCQLAQSINSELSDVNSSTSSAIVALGQENNNGTTIQLDHNLLFIPSKQDLNKLNVFELNEIIEQIESHTKELSDTLVQEFALRDELEYEKETRNTFISLLMSIQDKRRQLSLDNLNSSHSSSSLLKKKNRKSLINFNLEANNSTHLTTVIPYNRDIEYTVQHLQILNKLLKAINDDSHQVPELLTNYILKVVCPT